ncbi:hypothetical protein AXG93_4548s1040 [Marchantia polymorpha subsp. ruderalis]|uniref:Uncharacterized protein n=1 Tax=Marchantia polymorpha subsp. ruderalis TaxID=1480154 RepID=A0A176W8M8_MARPO|nr:hypothetical protein AXG93_4548s1040 [Marchantia polymorpha subsp. ruderalis]
MRPPMANPHGNPHPPPFTKHSYPKFKGWGDDDDADSNIKLFESVSITNKEYNDADRMRSFLVSYARGLEAGLTMKVPLLLRSKSDDIEEVIALTGPFKISMLNRRRKDRGFGDCERKSKSSQHKRRAATPSSSKFLSLSESNEAEDSSSFEDENPRKKSNGLKKGRHMTMPEKRFFVYKWALAWVTGGYYVKNAEDTAYAVQEGSPMTPIQRAHNPRYAPKKVATTVPQRRMMPPGATVRALPNAWLTVERWGITPLIALTYIWDMYQCANTAAECNQPRSPRAQVGFVTPPAKDDVQVNEVELSLVPKDEDNSWPDENTMGIVREETGKEMEGRRRKQIVGELCPIFAESSVAKSDAAASTTDEEKREKPTLRAVEEGPSEEQAEVLMEVAVETLEERTATISLSLPPSE